MVSDGAPWILVVRHNNVHFLPVFIKLGVNTIKTAIVLNIMAIVGLSGCGEPKIPVGINPGYLPTVAQVLDVYARYAQLGGKSVKTTEGVQTVHGFIKTNQTRPLTRAEVLKLLEQDLRDQAGIIVIHRDRKHVVFGLAAASSQPFSKPNGCNEDWLNVGRIKNALAEEIAITSNQDLGLDHQKKLVALQKHANILLKLVDVEPEQLKVLHSSLTVVQTNFAFPVSDLGQFISSANHGKPIRSVVIILPQVYLGRTPEIELMRDMDAVLCNAGVKQRTFETAFDGVVWYGLQSPSD